MYQLFPNVDKGKLKEELELFIILWPLIVMQTCIYAYMHFII